MQLISQSISQLGVYYFHTKTSTKRINDNYIKL